MSLSRYAQHTSDPLLLEPVHRMFHLPVDINMIRLDKGQHKQQEYLSINPLGKVRL